jgi:hypothetical protein
LLFQLGEQIVVLVPAGVHALDEAHAALDESAGDEAVVGKGALREHIGAVAIEHMLRFLGEIEQVGHAGLHLVGHLELRDARLDLRIAVVLEMRFIHEADVIEQGAALLAAHAGRIAQVGHGIADIAKAHALIPAGQEAAAPVVVVEKLAAGLAFVR